jgi:OOP family OmpA-OmpF porin
MARCMLAAGISAGLCCALLAATSPAIAQPAVGPYVAGGGGGNFINTADATTNAEGNGTFQFETGWAAIGALGYGFGGPRVELEPGYRRNALDKTADGSAAGSWSALSLMANVLYDFGTGTRLTPYLGAGAGIIRVKAEDFVVPDNIALDGPSTVKAYQGLAGLAYALTDRLALDLSVRFVAADKPRFAVRRTANGGGGGGGGGATRADVEYRQETVMMSLRYSFGAATQ